MPRRSPPAHVEARLGPRLRDAGFSAFAARTAWRHHDDRIDVVEVQTFTAARANALGCTTASFALNLGCYLAAIPPYVDGGGPKRDGGRAWPLEHECHLRGQLLRSYRQRAWARRDIWYVDPAGDDLERALDDVERQIDGVALPWFGRFADPDFALSLLLEGVERPGELWGFGGPTSPVRDFFAGYVAWSRGRSDVACARLRRALASGSFDAIAARMEADAHAACAAADT